MEDIKRINITFRISSIKTLKFNIDNTEEVKNTDRKSFHFNIALGTFINPKDKIIGFDVIQAVSLNKDMTNRVSEIISRVEFEIVNFDEIVQENDNLKEIKVPDQVMLMLTSISLSTARGIFAAKVEGSALEGVYMPIVNPASFKNLPVPNKEKAKTK